MTQTVLLVGAYGQNNIGDDALLEVFLDQLRNDEVIVNSAQPEQTGARYGVTAVPTYLRLPRFARVSALVRADLLVFGGGSLLKETEGSAAARIAYFLRLLGVLAAVRLTGGRSAMVSVGMGPLDGRLYRWLAKLAADMTDFITVRDEPSRALLQEIGVRTPVGVTADPVFTLAPVPPADRADDGHPEVAVIPRYSLSHDERVALAAACDRLVEQRDARIRFVTFQTGFRPEFDDDACAREVRGMMRHAAAAETWVPTRVEETMAGLGAADLVISARLHGLIFAAIQGVGSIAIGYDMKVKSFMDLIARGEFCLSLDELREGRLPDAIERAWPGLETAAEDMRPRVAELAGQARRSFALLSERRAAWQPATPRERVSPA